MIGILCHFVAAEGFYRQILGNETLSQVCPVRVRSVAFERHTVGRSFSPRPMFRVRHGLEKSKIRLWPFASNRPCTAPAFQTGFQILMCEKKLEDTGERSSSSITPAIEPFEKIYGTADRKTDSQILVPPPNPIMLDGIWKKRPRQMRKMVCRNYLCHVGNVVAIAWKRWLGRTWD